MSDWNSNQYLKFEKQRTQPALDLASRILEYQPKTVADIGCGPGNSTAVLKKLLPEAQILGIDNSRNMIEKARCKHPELSFALGDARTLEGQYDLLFSNACLQWLPDHETLIPALMDKLTPGGVLAVQMPRNQDEPLFRLIREIVAEPQWGLEGVHAQEGDTLTPDAYFDIITPYSRAFDLWETQYYHVLPSHCDLVDWVKGARLRPYLEHLGEARGAELEEELVRRAKAVYPVTQSGEVILGFRRLFFTAVR